MRRSWHVVALLAGLIAFPAPGQAVDSSSRGGPDLTAARTRIKAKDFQGALDELRRVEYTQHPDVYSLMGFSYRKSGDRPRAFSYYQKALSADPDHLGALEYQGELFVEVGQVDKARENVAHLRRLCPAGCEELEDLEEAIKDAAKKK